MRSVTIAVLLATVVLTVSGEPVELAEDLVAEPSEISARSSTPPVKLDKNLRRALLKALVDLEAESVEQQQQSVSLSLGPGSKEADEESRTTERPIDETKYDFLEISKQKSASFSFDGFPSEEDIPSEDKLQNSSFVEVDKYAPTGDSQQTSEHQRPEKDYVDVVQVHHVIPSEKASAIYEGKPAEQLETVESRNIASSSSSSDSDSDPSQIQKSVTKASIMETIAASASGNVVSAAANSLVAPRPTASTSILSSENATTKKESSTGSKIVQVMSKQKSEEAENVKIFQAPLVAAFTVQQDERGIPKSVVPLYKSNTAGSGSQSQPLSLQEQLEFKQRLLEKQLHQLQLQQAQQTQLLIRQRQAYEEQLRQKQQHEFFLQEQRRIKQLQEQESFLKQQRLQQQQQQQFSLNSIQRLPSPANFQLQPQQQVNLLQQQQLPQQQQQQSFKPSSVQLQPSLGLELPNNLPAANFHGQLQHQPLFGRLAIQQQQQQQQRQHGFQQSFPLEFQQLPSVASLNRFNRQEGFGSVGNFGFNGFQGAEEPLRSSGQFFPSRLQPQNTFIFGGTRQSPLPQQQRSFSRTPARQIQDLLYQSGIAGDLQGAGTRNQEDVNIVSKVLALNVGSLPNGGQRLKGFQQQQFIPLKK